MIAALLGDFGPWIIAALCALGSALGLYLKGRGDGKARADAKASKAALDTIERIEDAKERASAGGATWHDRLRDSE